MKRGALFRKTPLRPVSAKRTAHRKSDEGKAGLAHMARVAQLPCVICGAWPVQVHHCISGRYSRRKASDYATIPLCWNHHLGPEGIHSGKATWEALHGPDTGYLDAVRALLGGE